MEENFSYILRDCGYLVDYDTVYVLVDTRDLADHAARDPSLPHWQAAVAWWESRLQLTGPMGSALNFASSQRQNILAYTKYIPRGRAPLSLLPLVPHFRANISSCWIAIAYLLHYLKLLTYGRKPILPDFRWVLRSPAKL